ncbi:MAG: porin family protein [Bacteroidales bacterium]|nr:porin family protein [Bacteroidales bacterium]
MKKIISLCMIAVCLLMAVPAQAQLHFGVKGGLNLSKISFSSSDLKGDNKTGWFIGPMAEFTVPIIGVGVDVAALYSQTELGVDGYADNTDKLKTIEVPVNLKWSFGLGSMAGIYVAAGPQFGFNIGNKSGSFLDYELKKNNTSFNVGAGVKLIKHLQIGVNYNFALSNTAEFTIPVDGGPSHTVKVKNNTWQASLAYIF